MNRIVATIDGDPVTLIELERYAEIAKKRPGGDQVVVDQKAILDELVLDKIIAKQVETLGLKASEQQIDGYIESIRSRNNLSEEQLMEALKQQGMSWDQYRRAGARRHRARQSHQPRDPHQGERVAGGGRALLQGAPRRVRHDAEGARRV